MTRQALSLLVDLLTILTVLDVCLQERYWNPSRWAIHPTMGYSSAISIVVKAAKLRFKEVSAEMSRVQSGNGYKMYENTYTLCFCGSTNIYKNHFLKG